MSIPKIICDILDYPGWRHFMLNEICVLS